MVLWLNRISWILALLITAAFFLPWLNPLPLEKMPSRTLRAITEELAKADERPWWEEYFGWPAEDRRQVLSQPLTGVSGYQLVEELRSPKRAESRAARSAMHWLGEERIEDKAWILYVVPITALLAACFCSVCRSSQWPLVVPLLGSAILYGVGRIGLNEYLFERWAENIQIGLGVWLSLYGLLVLWLVLLLRFFVLPGKR